MIYNDNNFNPIVNTYFIVCGQNRPEIIHLSVMIVTRESTVSRTFIPWENITEQKSTGS